MLTRDGVAEIAGSCCTADATLTGLGGLFTDVATEYKL